MELTERVVLTNMCMVKDTQGRYLLQDRMDPGWPGLVFPGGHVEKGESIVESVIREVREETGMTVKNPRLCGVKQFWIEDGSRYLVFLFKAAEAEGTLCGSDEGDALWLTMPEIRQRRTVSGFDDFLHIFEDETVSELMYDSQDEPIFF